MKIRTRGEEEKEAKNGDRETKSKTITKSNTKKEERRTEKKEQKDDQERRNGEGRNTKPEVR